MMREGVANMGHPWATILTVTLSLMCFLVIQLILRWYSRIQRQKAVHYIESIQGMVLSEIRSPERLAAIAGVRGAAAKQQEFLDGICRTAANTLKMPASIMTVVDHDKQGTIATWAPEGHPMEVGLEASFCKYVVAFRKPLVIEDAQTDRLVMTSEGTAQAYREGLRSYLGVPLYIEGEDGVDYVVGTLCVFDKREPHKWSSHDMLALEALADLVDLNDKAISK